MVSNNLAGFLSVFQTKPSSCPLLARSQLAFSASSVQIIEVTCKNVIYLKKNKKIKVIFWENKRKFMQESKTSAILLFIYFMVLHVTEPPAEKGGGE